MSPLKAVIPFIDRIGNTSCVLAGMICRLYILSYPVIPQTKIFLFHFNRKIMKIVLPKVTQFCGMLYKAVKVPVRSSCHTIFTFA